MDRDVYAPGERERAGQAQKQQAQKQPAQKQPAQQTSAQGRQERKKGQGQDRQQRRQPSTSEWIVGILSTLLVVAALGYILYEALTDEITPPIVTVRPESVMAIPGGYVVEFSAHNEGTTTAANLAIEGTLERDTVTVERSGTTLNYLPAETEREGGLFFTRNPSEYRLEIRPTGYDRP